MSFISNSNRISSQQHKPITLRKLHLRTTLVVPFVLQIVTAVGLVGYLSYKNGQEAVNDLANQLRVETAARVEDRVQRYLNTPHLIHEINARAIQQNLLDLNNTDQLLTYFWQQSQVFKEFGTIAFANNQGDFVGANGAQKYLTFTVSDPETGRSLQRYAMDSQGNLGEFISERKNYDARIRSWYKTAVAAGKPTWSEVEASTIGQRLDIDAVYPLYNNEGTLQGVFQAGFDLSLIGKFLQTLKIGKTGQAFIIERNGLIIANSTGEIPFIPGVTEKDEPQRLPASQSNNPIIQNAVQTLIQTFGNLHRIQDAQQLDFLIDGERHFLEVLPFTDGRGIDWLILVNIPESDFIGQIHANIRNTILLCGLALILAIIIGILTARLITAPILRLTQASQELASGHLDQRVETKNWIELEEIDTLEQSFNSMAEQLQESFETLEDKVKDRTNELAQANQEINALNQRLKAENLRMGAELDVARQIQQMILPKSEELANIEGLDITGYMEPADEVGGDYYDVLHTENIVTVGIGDVTGHGLESGLLMLMTQTAVRTLQEVREHDPVRFLDTLNRAIYKNVQRMNSHRNLTLAILNYTQGRLSISGQHEETIVVRQGGQIERIDTLDLGLPIGLESDISDLISHRIVELKTGDGIVVYTDGITEAWNMDRKQYGIERLCQVLSQNWEQSASGIKEAVIADLRQFIGKQKVFDDITLLVLKRQD